MAEQRRAVGQIFGFEKQLAERGMRQVVGRRREDDLGVAGDVDLANARTLIHHRQTPHFDVVFGGDGDVQLRGHLIVVPAERGLVGAEVHEVVVRLDTGWVIRGRPDRAGPRIAQVDELAARIARRVPTRFRDRQSAAKTAPAARVAHNGDVGAVRQELRVRNDRMRRSITPRRRCGGRCDHAHFVERPRLNRRCVPRHALLQQQLRCLHSRIGVKSPDHRVVEQRVGERDDGHACVVRKIRTDNSAVEASRWWNDIARLLCAARRVVNRVEESVIARDAGVRSASAGWRRLLRVRALPPALSRTARRPAHPRGPV